MSLHHGDCLDVMATFDANSVDAIVTDPPYHLTTGKKGGSGAASVNLASPYGRARIGTGFMGMGWDGGDVAMDPATWVAVLRVAKPGAHLVAFGGTRTYHRLTCAIEDAGWEIRDCLSWLYGSGFPKSHNGPWGGTALKPAWEPIVLARKPLAGTVAANVEEHGTGALNIDGCRIATDGTRPLMQGPPKNGEDSGRFRSQGGYYQGETALGRWPANLVLDEDAAAMLDAQTGERIHGAGRARTADEGSHSGGQGVVGFTVGAPAPRYGDTGGASRFFYCGKASRSERNAGVTGEARPLNWSAGTQNPGSFQSAGTDRSARNHHPTVKPLDLMRWLCRLITPPGGLILDPFMGSGSTGCAAALEGFRFVGIERDAEYLAIARQRIAYHGAQAALPLGGAA